MKFFDEGKIFFQPNHFFSKNENLRKKYSNVTFNFSVYHPPLGQPWDFTWFFIPMVGTSLKFWSLGWGTSFIYTTQPSGLHWRIFPRPPGAPGGMVDPRIEYHITGRCYPGDTLRHLKYEERIVEERFKDLFSFIFWRGTRFSYLESAYGCVSAQKLTSNFSYFQTP